MQLSKKTFKNYIISIFGIGFSRGIAFLNSAIIARFLGPSKFGEFAIFQIVMVLTWQFASAFDTTFVRYAKSGDTEMEKNAFLKSTIFMKLIYIFIVWTISFPLSYLLAHKVFAKPEIFQHIYIAMFCGSFLVFLMTTASFYQSREKFVMFSIVMSSFAVLICLSILCVYFFHGNLVLNELIKLYFVVTILIGLICFVFLFKKGGNPFPLEKQALAKSFKLSKWILGVTAVFFIFQKIDTLFLTRLMIFENIGLYFAATQIVMFVGLLSGPLSSVFLPMASTALESKESLKIYFKESLVAVGFVNLFIIFLILFAPLILQISFGREYASASLVLRILLLGWVFWIFYQPLSFLFYTLDDSRTRFVLELTKLGMGIILLFQFVPSMGIVGAALSIAIALALNAIISIPILCLKLSKKVKILNRKKLLSKTTI